MSLSRMSEEHRRMRSLSRANAGNLLLVAHAVKQYLKEMHDGGEGSTIGLELAMDLLEGIRAPIPELAGAKVLKPEKLAEIACKAFKEQKEPH